jgi:hypothetical protein
MVLPVGGRKKNGLKVRFSAHPQPAPQCVGEAHWSVGRRRLGRPARPRSQYPRVLLGGAATECSLVFQVAISQAFITRTRRSYSESDFKMSVKGHCTY